VDAIAEKNLPTHLGAAEITRTWVAGKQENGLVSFGGASL